ncbi:MAG: heavy metal-binding domain-containing protein, partial [Elusimicrobiota bacterium]|nr:heavy metal-binding domain-containing protein [Elusimicrobiota bacterium]
MRKFFVFCGMFLASCLLVNRVSASSCHGGSGGYQDEEKSAAKPEVKKDEVKRTFYSKIYVCPMHPEVKSDKPGKCPE